MLFHKILLKKLIQIDCDGDAAIWSKSWQSNSKQRIMLSGYGWSSGNVETGNNAIYVMMFNNIENEEYKLKYVEVANHDSSNTEENS